MRKTTTLRLPLLLLLFLYSISRVWGQDTLRQIALKEITVYGMGREKYAAGAKIYRVDSTLIQQQPTLSLGELISRQAPVNFKSYGNGMLSSVSFRGTSASHTAVLWNGISINSPTAGQSDFSILPPFAFDQVTIQVGGASALYGSDAIGGTIQVGSQLATERGLKATLLQQAGSFRTFGTQALLAFGNSHWTARTKIYRMQSANNFPFRNTSRFGTPIDRQTHAGFSQTGLLQDIVYQPNTSNRFALYTWYHDNQRDIQPTMSVRQNDETQDDCSLRMVGEYTHQARRSLTQFKLGYVRDALDYRKPSTPIDSHAETSRYLSRLEHELTLSHQLLVRAGADITHFDSYVDGYGRRIRENRSDVFILVRYQLNSRWLTSLNIRQAFVTGFRAPLAPSLGSEYRLWQHHDSRLVCKTSLSRNYRVPTLNDRYWVTGGNPHLRPEDGLGGEAGLAFERGTEKGKFSVELTHYQYWVNHWIQWTPDSAGNWKAQNLLLVYSRGLEGTAKYRMNASRWSAEASLQYAYSPASQEKVYQNASGYTGGQLFYTPRHNGVGYLQVSWKGWLLSTQFQYTGLRFTSEDNRHSLPAYGLLHASISRNVTWRSTEVAGVASLNNLTNTAYQSIPNRAMPGRNYSLSLKISWKTSPQ